MQNPFFSTGGTLAPDDPSYIVRSADIELEQHLRAGNYVSVLDARQKGKSSLVARAIQKFTANGFRCIKIDLQRYGSNLTETQWCAGIAATIEQQIGEKSFLARFNKRSKEVGPTTALFDCISGLVSESDSPQTILFCDEIDFVRVLPFPADGFFAAIRSLYNERSITPGLDRLNFCLIGSASPDQLVQNQSTAPFDIAKTVILQDFTVEETYPYAKELPRNTDAPKACLDQIHYWCQGHPYLTQSVCAELTISKDPSISEVNSLVQSNFLSKNSIEKNAHLNQIANAFLSPSNQEQTDLIPGCLDTYRQILRAPQDITKYRKDVLSHIRLCGLISIDNGIATPRNRIYSRVFNQAWIRANLPSAERERQKAAARAAAIKTGAVAISICATMAWLAVSNLQLAQQAQRALLTSQKNEKRAEQQAYFSAIQVAGNQVNSGNWIASGKTLANLDDSSQRGWEWYYLNQILNQQVSTFHINEPIVTTANHGSSLDFTALGRNSLIEVKNGVTKHFDYATPDAVMKRLSNNGQFLILRGEKRTTQITTPDGKIVFQTDANPINFSRDSDYLFTQNPDRKQIEILSTENWQVIKEVPFDEGTAYNIHMDSDQSQMVVCFNNRVIGYDLRQNRVSWQRSTPNDARFSLLTRDGQSVLLTFAGGPAEKWNRYSGKTETVFEDPSGPIIVISESTDGRLIATGGGNGVVTLYRSTSQTPVKKFVGHHGRIAGLWFSNQDNQIISSSEDGEIRTWDLKSASDTMTFVFGTPSPAYAQSTKSGDRVAIGKLNGEIGIVSGETGENIFTLQDNPGSVPRIGFFNRDQSFFILSAKFGLQLRASLDGRLLSEIKPFKSPVIDFDIKQIKDKPILTTLEVGGRLLKIENFRNPIDVQLSSSSPAERFAISEDLKWIAVGHSNGMITLLDFVTGKEVDKFSLHRTSVRNINFSSDSKFLVSASNDETCAVFDLKTRRMSHRLVGHTSRIFNAVFSPDNSKILSISFDGTARLWDSKTGNLLNTLQHKSWVADANFSPDGSRIVSGGNDQTVHIWDTNSGQELLALENHNSAIFRTLFVDKGRRIITVNGSGLITVMSTNAPPIEAAP